MCCTAQVAREKLCEMQIPYLYRNVARGSPKRQELQDKYGIFQVRTAHSRQGLTGIAQARDIYVYPHAGSEVTYISSDFLSGLAHRHTVRGLAVLVLCLPTGSVSRGPQHREHVV